MFPLLRTRLIDYRGEDQEIVASAVFAAPLLS
jgi:hypothetical protein